MQTLRRLLACLLLMAIPLHGLAAASMVVCSGAPTVAAVHHAPTPSGTLAASHDVQHGHHGHFHGGAAHAVADGAGHDMSHASFDGAHDADGGSHRCAVCAFCGHGLALGATGATRVFAALPQWQAPSSVMAVHNAPLPVPDKPPRA